MWGNFSISPQSIFVELLLLAYFGLFLRFAEMPGAMEMSNPTISRKRPLTDANLDLNTPKREYYQQFHPYPYMNMVSAFSMARKCCTISWY